MNLILSLTVKWRNKLQPIRAVCDEHECKRAEAKMESERLKEISERNKEHQQEYQKKENKELSDRINRTNESRKGFKRIMT